MGDFPDTVDPSVAPTSEAAPRRRLRLPEGSIPLALIPRRGTCPSCKIGDMSRDYNMWRKCSALLLLPDCLLDLCFKREQRCPICEYVAPMQ